MQRFAYRCHKPVLRAVLLIAVYSLPTLAAMAQEPVGKAGEPQKLTAPAKEELSSAPAKVEVSPVARDEEIVKRLQSILHATNWFTGPQVRVAEGVVFLNGQVESEELKNWAGDLARNTRDVVAVVNRMEVLEPPVWDFRPASSGLAADLFRPICDATGGIDGWVCLEVSPLLSYDNTGSIKEATKLHGRAKRPNLFIKIPGTPEGLPAIQETIFKGMPVNVTKKGKKFCAISKA